MSERILSSGGGSTAPRSTSKNMFLVLGGTAAIAFVAGFMLQFARPMTGQAQEKSASAGKATVAGAKAEPTRYLARIVNGKSTVMVSYDEVAHECMLRHGAEVLENLINRKVIELACESSNIQVSEQEVDQEVLKMAQKFKMDPEQWYTMLQAERNVTRAQYRRDIIWPMLSLRKLAGEDIKITQAEQQRAFERNYGQRVKARIIVQDNQRHAAEAWEMVTSKPNDPAVFDAAVKKYSNDASSRSLGGAVPPIPRYSGNPLSESLEQAAFKLKAGEISNVIQVGQQYIIIKCEGRTEQVVSNMDEVKMQLLAELKEEKIQQAVAETFEKIREGSRIDNYLTHEVSGGQKKPAGAAGAPGAVKQTAGQGAAAAPGAGRAALNTRPKAPVVK